MKVATTTRLSADERRDSVVAAATVEFAAGGFAGTSTDAIAHRAGVSQPYLFQLFGTKKDLFIAVVRNCFGQVRSVFEGTGREAAGLQADPGFILYEMGCAYVRLLEDRDRLRLQLQAYAACDDPDIRAVVREEFTDLYQAVARVSKADEEALHAWFAEGMLLNVAASIGEGVIADKFTLAQMLGAANPSG